MEHTAAVRTEMTVFEPLTPTTLALVSEYGTTTVTDSQWVHFAVLLGISVIAPTLINEWRN